MIIAERDCYPMLPTGFALLPSIKLLVIWRNILQHVSGLVNTVFYLDWLFPDTICAPFLYVFSDTILAPCFYVFSLSIFVFPLPRIFLTSFCIFAAFLCIISLVTIVFYKKLKSVKKVLRVFPGLIITSFFIQFP